MENFQPTFPVYGVEQSNHGHLYRWIYTKEDILRELSEAGYNNVNLKDDCVDLWPIGGSNSSCATITELPSLDEVKSFLLSDYDTEYGDPMLVDVAEGIYTIDTDDSYYHSITSKFVEALRIPKEELTQNNSLYQPALDMIKQIYAFDNEESSGIDYVNPFYGDSSDMHYSELGALLDSYKAAKNGFYIEITYPEQKQQVLQILEEKGYRWISEDNLIEYGMLQKHMNFIYVKPLCDSYLQWRTSKPEETLKQIPLISGYDFVRESDLYFSKMQKPSETIHM